MLFIFSPGKEKIMEDTQDRLKRFKERLHRRSGFRYGVSIDELLKTGWTMENLSYVYRIWVDKRERLSDSDLEVLKPTEEQKRILKTIESQLGESEYRNFYFFSVQQLNLEPRDTPGEFVLNSVRNLMKYTKS